MSNQSVKMKTSIIPAKSDQEDNFKLNKSNEDKKVTSGGSEYDRGDARTTKWKATLAGGAIVPGIQEDTTIETIANWIDDIKNFSKNHLVKKRPPFIRPRNKTHIWTRYFKSHNSLPEIKIEEKVPPVPDVSQLMTEIEDAGIVKHYYINAIETLESYKSEVKEFLKEEKDPELLRKYKELSLLIEKRITEALNETRKLKQLEESQTA